MSTPSPPPAPAQPTESAPPTTTTTSQTQTLPILTNHCRFCNHLLLATTHKTTSLPRRKEPAKDGALILPLPSPTETNTSADADADGDNTVEQDAGQKHYSILLSTALPDRRATMVRREDGFEKRRFLRCGRCRVVVGYFLDAVHFPTSTEKEQDEEERAKVVYLLPGALVETDDMGDAEKMKAIDREWSNWTPV